MSAGGGAALRENPVQISQAGRSAQESSDTEAAAAIAAGIDGSELFGTRSGDGFADLAAFDADANGWIDENDALYDRLLLWSKDGAGTDALLMLADADVGAIHLGRVATPFALKDSANALLGEIRTSGLFLHEDGRSGSVQQIDLTV